MSPYTRIALTLVRLVAAGFLVVGAMDLGLYWFQSRHNRVELNPGRCLYLSIPLVIGLALLVRSSALARRLGQWLDD